jgi:hypothetical protein
LRLRVKDNHRRWCRPHPPGDRDRPAECHWPAICERAIFHCCGEGT